jgi:hypothetical protein
VAVKIAAKAKDFTSKFPTISISKTHVGSNGSARRCRVAVVMEREQAPNRWEDWRLRVADVVPDDGGFGDAPPALRDDGKTAHSCTPASTSRCSPTRPRVTT